MMSPQTKVLLQRVAAALIAATIIGLATATLSNSTRITAVEVKIENIVDSQGDIKKTLETNRVENNDAHREILNEVKGLRK